MTSDFASRTTTPPRAVPFRLMRCIWRQHARTPRCPEEPRLDGKLALVTGGNAGIGRAIARGLATRGAEVLLAARNQQTSAEVRARLASETGAVVHEVALDLADLATVGGAVDGIARVAAGRRIAVLVANAGLWPHTFARSAQGHEIAFAVNTLGHYALVRRLLDRALLDERARVVILTGDIYIRANDCSDDFAWEGRSGGGLAYCRSKLGNLWFAAELQRRYPKLEVVSVHPGVVASGLGGQDAEAGGFFRERVMIDVEKGAQTPLWCATQPVERGAYYHNTMGRMQLGPRDPASDAARARALWERMEALDGATARPATG